jgi:hypothetical protein
LSPSHARTLSHDFEQRYLWLDSGVKSRGYPRIVRLAVLLAVPASLLAPAAAQAAPTLVVDVAKPSVGFGAAHTVMGTLADGLTGMAGQQVILEGRRYPYEGSYRVIAKAATDAKGNFTFKPKLDRDTILRVVAPAQRATSARVHAYTLPSFTLSFRAVAPGVARLSQRYTVPKDVKLSSPTHFYLGKHGAKVASRQMTGATLRTSAGHYTATVKVRLPAAWKGRFRFGSCFRTSPGSGMGDPRATCPKVKLRF